MGRIELINASCADQTVDVVVNAANDGLWAGGGICGVIFRKAGMSELTEACRKYTTPLNDGDAVITPAFKELFDAYYNSLKGLMENGYHSISFPLISSGIFGGSLDNPVGESTKQCLRAYQKFTADHPDYEIDVKLCAFTISEMQEATREYETFYSDSI